VVWIRGETRSMIRAPMVVPIPARGNAPWGKTHKLARAESPTRSRDTRCAGTRVRISDRSRLIDGVGIHPLAAVSALSFLGR